MRYGNHTYTATYPACGAEFEVTITESRKNNPYAVEAADGRLINFDAILSIADVRKAIQAATGGEVIGKRTSRTGLLVIVLAIILWTIIIGFCGFAALNPV